MYTPFCPVELKVLTKTEGLAAVRQTLTDGGYSRVLVLVPRELCGLLSLAPFFTAIQGDGHAVQLMTALSANPDVQDICARLDELRETGFVPDVLLAIGGGSCIDTAKALSAFYHLPPQCADTPQAVRQTIADKRCLEPHPFVDIVAMPTTSGTGSEVTRWATIWDSENRRKLSIECPELVPKAAVLIPEFTAGIPDTLTLSTGLDALCHAMEAFWARSRTPLSQALAYTAIHKIRDFLPLALRSPQSITYRRELALASLLAGMAFAQTRTTACHSLSYPLTMLFGVPHGYAAALTLAAVAKRNLAEVPELDTVLALFDGDLGRWLDETASSVKPLRLSAFGIDATDLAAITELSFTAGRMDNNPVAFDAQDVLNILRESL